MPDFETFVIGVYVTVDEFRRRRLPPDPPPRGRPPGLCRSEVPTLALVGQLGRFESERAFARFAHRRLRGLFAGLPERSRLNRLLRAAHDDMRLGWFEGARLLVAVTPEGAVTGYGLAPGNEQDRALAEAFLARRAAPAQDLPSAGRPASGCYLADAGFAGRAARARWAERYDAHVYAPPQPDGAERRPPALRRWHASARQIVETACQRLLQGLRLERDRPRSLGGLLARVAAKVAMHNVLIDRNRRDGRPDLAIADAVGW